MPCKSSSSAGPGLLGTKPDLGRKAKCVGEGRRLVLGKGMRSLQGRADGARQAQEFRVRLTSYKMRQAPGRRE